MIKGVGTDLIEISRIKRAVERPEFLNRIYTPGEIGEYERRNKNISFLAGCFAAKEAFAKALGTGFRGFGFLDIEIKKDALGKPYLALLKEFHLSEKQIHLSITHSREVAQAFCVIEE